ncbi:zinc ribbon-containing protein [Oenococcus oeni]|nr:hypothetical protein [Oenococcus oeni]
MYETGDKPGIGHYKCLSCGEIIYLNQNTDTLPPCPRCSGIHWTKVN